MKVALIGATGNAGQPILTELVRRGHTVAAISRNPPPTAASVEPKPVDITDQGALIEALRGVDAVVSAVKFKDSDTAALIAAVKASGVRRYVVVGGAGSLKLPTGEREVDAPGFPPHVRPEALKGGEFLEQLRATDLDWTFLSPSRIFTPGERTGHFRVGQDDLLFDADGKSHISFEDYALALVDELETPKHLRARFTVGY